MKIVFCCTGNTCRSPMAEQLLRFKLKKLNIDNIDVESCGVMCHSGDCMNEHAVTALKKLGVMPTRHFSKAITKSVIEESNLIICMTSAHREYLKAMFGENNKIADINQIVGMGDVNDPFGGCLASYELCASIISEMLDKLITIITSDKNNQN